jgi:hypothetical protein
VRHGVSAWHLPAALQLAVEVAVGALSYLGAALLLARRATRELFVQVRGALRAAPAS